MNKKKIYCFYVLLLTLASGFVVHAAPPHPRFFLRQPEDTLRLSMSSMNIWQFAVTDIPKRGYKPQPDGIEYILAIRIDFSDQPGQKPDSVFNDAIFGTDGTSMKLYFEEVSYGQMHIQPGYLGSVMPTGERWYRASKPMSYYGEGTLMDSRYKELSAEACAAVDPEVDFSRYDRDGDGYIDHLMIIHAGDDEAASMIPDDIWSAEIDVVPGEYDGIRVLSAMIVAEDPSNDFINVGIYCHEFFHELGAPDLYSWDLPVGHWCLMGRRGPYQDDGRHPSHISGYLKWDFDADPSNGITGWIKPIEITSPGTYSVDSFELPIGNRLYKINIPGKRGREYFLIENRNKDSDAIYDTHLPDSGIVIWHIDENQPDRFSNPPRVWVEDPSDPDHTGFIDPTAGAAYSQNDGQTSFTPATRPDTRANDGTYTGIIISDIGPEGMSISFTFSSGDTYEPNDVIADAYGPLVYGRRYISYIKNSRDTDFYSFHADANRTVIVYLEDIPENTNYDLQVFDSRGEVLATSTEPQNRSEVLSFETRIAGIYYAQIIPRYGYNPNKPYSLAIDSVPLAPGVITVSRVYPNPGPGSKDGIWFDYKLITPVEGIILNIYTPDGTLIHSQRTPDVDGAGRLLWDVRNYTGQKVASGIYIYALKAELNGETDIETGKIAIVY